MTTLSPDVVLPSDPVWKRDYSGSVRRLVRDGVDVPLANLFVHAARTVSSDAEGADRARSASEAFLYRRLETLADTNGRFRLNVPLPIAFDGMGTLEVDLLCADARVALELDGAQHLADPIADLGALDWGRLPGTEGASTPFWSPDSRYVGFIVDDTLGRIDTTGGPPETVASLPTAAARSGTWNRHGDIVLGSWGGGAGGPVWRVSAAGGAVTPLTQVDLSKGEFVHTWPTFLPDGKHFLYFRSGPPDVEGMYVGSLDVDAGNQSRQRILATCSFRAPAR